jgi:hypothetical protein
MVKGNALQAVLDRAKAGGDPVRAPSTPAEAPAARGAQGSRRGTKLIGGHFPPEVSTQLRILAAEGETTVQSLLAEALDDLFVKKGRNRVGRGSV